MVLELSMVAIKKDLSIQHPLRFMVSFLHDLFQLFPLYLFQCHLILVHRDPPEGGIESQEDLTLQYTTYQV